MRDKNSLQHIRTARQQKRNGARYILLPAASTFREHLLSLPKQAMLAGMLFKESSYGEANIPNSSRNQVALTEGFNSLLYLLNDNTNFNSMLIIFQNSVPLPID